MSIQLRVLLMAGAVLTAVWIMLRIRKMKVKMEDAIFWLLFAIVLLVMGLFPKVTYWLTGLVHMQSPANLIFLLILALLIEKVFTLSILVSQLEDKVTVLSAELALRSHAVNKEMSREKRKVVEESTEDPDEVGTVAAEALKEGEGTPLERAAEGENPE